MGLVVDVLGSLTDISLSVSSIKKHLEIFHEDDEVTQSSCDDSS